ncbi:MAG TPA: helix-turn-helix domain-containing protein, partial [Candidatus Acidoferrales bacterium]|nr:helix-turn-helix domain-containing protein [Candidatus Acidoferrales bacterium]
VLIRIENRLMTKALHQQRDFSDYFMTYLLTRKARVEADLVDQLFNSSEKRLARTLLMMARYGREGAAESTIPKVSQETLASMVGTTRSRISFFMNKFRKMGFIKYNGGMQVHGSLLNVLLHD